MNDMNEANVGEKRTARTLRGCGTVIGRWETPHKIKFLSGEKQLWQPRDENDLPLHLAERGTPARAEAEALDRRGLRVRRRHLSATWRAGDPFQL